MAGERRRQRRRCIAFHAPQYRRVEVRSSSKPEPAPFEDQGGTAGLVGFGASRRSGPLRESPGLSFDQEADSLPISGTGSVGSGLDTRSALREVVDAS